MLETIGKTKKAHARGVICSAATVSRDSGACDDCTCDVFYIEFTTIENAFTLKTIYQTTCEHGCILRRHFADSRPRFIVHCSSDTIIHENIIAGTYSSSALYWHGLPWRPSRSWCRSRHRSAGVNLLFHTQKYTAEQRLLAVMVKVQLFFWIFMHFRDDFGRLGGWARWARWARWEW